MSYDVFSQRALITSSCIGSKSRAPFYASWWRCSLLKKTIARHRELYFVNNTFICSFLKDEQSILHQLEILITLFKWNEEFLHYLVALRKWRQTWDTRRILDKGFIFQQPECASRTNWKKPKKQVTEIKSVVHIQTSVLHINLPMIL